MVKALDPGPPAQWAQEDRSTVLPQDPEVFEHDLDGNLTQDGLWTYEWDGENRLVAMESRTDLPATVTRQRLEIAYDGQSRRIQKTIKEFDPGTTSWITTEQIRFLYDEWNLISEYDALNSDALIRSHTWGLDVSGAPQGAGGVGGLLWTTTDSASFAPGFDANGNIIAWIDLSDGSLAGTIEHGAFGEVLTTSGVAGEMPFGFSTKYEDAETRLLYYGYRFYSPETGRWLNRDPIEEAGGLNLYGFVGNDSINSWDYLGLISDAKIFDELFWHWVSYNGSSIFERHNGDWGDFFKNYPGVAGTAIAEYGKVAKDAIADNSGRWQNFSKKRFDQTFDRSKWLKASINGLSGGYLIAGEYKNDKSKCEVQFRRVIHQLADRGDWHPGLDRSHWIDNFGIAVTIVGKLFPVPGSLKPYQEFDVYITWDAEDVTFKYDLNGNITSYPTIWPYAN